MNRRDFMKLFALSAAGIYIPRRTYFFMPKIDPSRDWTEIDLSTKPISVWVGDKQYSVQGSKLYGIGP